MLFRSERLKYFKSKKEIAHEEKVAEKEKRINLVREMHESGYGLMSIFWTQKVKLFYAALLANNSKCSGVM